MKNKVISVLTSSAMILLIPKVGFAGQISSEKISEVRLVQTTKKSDDSYKFDILPEVKKSTEIPQWYWMMSVVPGLGQMFLGDFERGMKFSLGMIFTGVIVPIFLSNFLVINKPEKTDLSSAQLMDSFLWIANTGIYGWNLYDAYNLNKQKSNSFDYKLQNPGSQTMNSNNVSIINLSFKF